jgi:hypothetical protein
MPFTRPSASTVGIGSRAARRCESLWSISARDDVGAHDVADPLVGRLEKRCGRRCAEQVLRCPARRRSASQALASLAPEVFGPSRASGRRRAKRGLRGPPASSSAWRGAPHPSSGAGAGWARRFWRPPRAPPGSRRRVVGGMRRIPATRGRREDGSAWSRAGSASRVPPPRAGERGAQGPLGRAGHASCSSAAVRARSRTSAVSNAVMAALPQRGARAGRRRVRTSWARRTFPAGGRPRRAPRESAETANAVGTHILLVASACCTPRKARAAADWSAHSAPRVCS